MLERDERRRDVPAKWVGLVGPIEAVRTSGIPGEGVLGLVVILENLRERIVLRILFGVGRGRRR